MAHDAQRMTHDGDGERGAALVYASVTALVTSIIVYGILSLVVSHSRQGRFSAERARARYAAEAGVVWAMNQLETNPQASFASGNVDLTVDGIFNVDVIAPACVQTPCEARQLQAKVNYAVY